MQYRWIQLQEEPKKYLKSILYLRQHHVKLKILIASCTMKINGWFSEIQLQMQITTTQFHILIACDYY